MKFWGEENCRQFLQADGHCGISVRKGQSSCLTGPVNSTDWHQSRKCRVAKVGGRILLKLLFQPVSSIDLQVEAAHCALKREHL